MDKNIKQKRNPSADLGFQFVQGQEILSHAIHLRPYPDGSKLSFPQFAGILNPDVLDGSALCTQVTQHVQIPGRDRLVQILQGSEAYRTQMGFCPQCTGYEFSAAFLTPALHCFRLRLRSVSAAHYLFLQYRGVVSCNESITRRRQGKQYNVRQIPEQIFIRKAR